MRILSGLQPTGRLHLGNYFGATVNHLAMQSLGDAFYFIADYHALTTVQNPETLRGYVLDLAIDYLAMGLNPDTATFFKQSDVPEVCELSWILSTVTGKGLLERAHAYKDKVGKGLDASMGLFCYPVLMAADILIYQSNLVPVGADQIQHIEMTRDIAGSFNSTYREVFTMPDAKLSAVPKLLGTDGEKMSKSYGNTIEIFEPANLLKKKVMSIKTDSKGVADPKDPDTCLIFHYYKLFATEQEQADLADRYGKGGMGYGDAKKLLLEKMENFIGPLRTKREEIVADLDYVNDVLKRGADRAGEEARKTMEKVRRAVGLRTRTKASPA
ncbi:MAG TPA: tryptophan--tRNA ligase [Planctomycetota bacterium]|nr:tryptophan--tRNA ligase [Planctomycetota bacterium]